MQPRHGPSASRAERIGTPNAGRTGDLEDHECSVAVLLACVLLVNVRNQCEEMLV
jgi:hypothetical protein